MSLHLLDLPDFMESILDTVFNILDCITLGFTPLKCCSASPECLCLDHLAQETMDLITNPFKQNLDGYGYVVASGWVSRPFESPGSLSLFFNNAYSRLPIIRTFKGNKKQFELSGVRVIEGKII